MGRQRRGCAPFSAEASLLGWIRPAVISRQVQGGERGKQVLSGIPRLVIAQNMERRQLTRFVKGGRRLGVLEIRKIRKIRKFSVLF